MKKQFGLLLTWIIGSLTLAASLTFDQRLLFPDYIQQVRYLRISAQPHPAQFTLYFITKIDQDQYSRGEGWIAISPNTGLPALFTIRHIAYTYNHQQKRVQWLIYSALIDAIISDSQKWIAITPENTSSGDSIMMQELDKVMVAKIQQVTKQKKLVLPIISHTPKLSSLQYFDGTLLQFVTVAIDQGATKVVRARLAGAAYRTVDIPDITAKNCYAGHYSPLFDADPLSDPNNDCNTWKKIMIYPTNLAIIQSKSEDGICAGSSGGAIFSEIGFSQWAVVGAVSSGPETKDGSCALKNIAITTFVL